MCGIFTAYGANYNWISLENSFNKISYRGPDSSSIVSINKKLIMAFHRLAIMGLSNSGNQPMKHPNDESLTLMCNGEIYNYKELAHKYNFILSTGSDCEIILHLFKEIGIRKTIDQLDGVFMFTIYDETNDILYAGRDPMGVRPGFIANYGDETFISSEAKSLIKFSKNIIPFPPGTWWSSDNPSKFERYFYYGSNKSSSSDENVILGNI